MLQVGTSPMRRASKNHSLRVAGIPTWPDRDAEQVDLQCQPDANASELRLVRKRVLEFFFLLLRQVG